MIEQQIWQICPREIPHCFLRGWELKENSSERSPRFKVNCCFLSRVLMSTRARDCLPPRVWVILSLRPRRYLSTVTRSSHQDSVDGFRRERLQTLATFDSLSVQRRLEAKSRKESRTIVCYLGGIWRRLEPLERIYRHFPSVDPSGRFAGLPNLGKPLYIKKIACSRLRDSRAHWIEKARTWEENGTKRSANFSRAFFFRVFPTIWQPGKGQRENGLQYNP